MTQYRVNYNHRVVQQWTCTVEADSEEEAIEKLHKGEDVDNEELCGEYGQEIFDITVKEEDGEKEE